MFNPEGYEKAKFTPEYNIARISALPDSNSYIVAFQLPENFMVIKDGQKTSLPDLEHGHHMAVVSSQNANSPVNYPNKLFTNIIQNTSLGKRGKAAIEMTTNTKTNHGRSVRTPFLPCISYRQAANQK